MTKQTKLLLSEMLRTPDGDHYGFEISRSTGLKPSTLYPTFARLEEAGWIEGRWEAFDPEQVRRPPRRYYRLTSVGQAGAIEALTAVASDPIELPGVLGA